MNWERLLDNPNSSRRYLVANLHPDEPMGHTVVFGDAAIANRMALYGLDSEDETIEHIMYEHFIRLNPLTPDEELPEKVRESFTRVWGPKQKAARGLHMTDEETAEHLRRFAEAKRTGLEEAQGRESSQ